MNNALAQCQRKLFGRYANIEVIAINPIAPSQGDAEAKERRFSTAA
jgi:hypothetical protein